MDTKQILTQAGNHVAEVLSKIDPAQVDAMAKAIAKANRVFVSGWGRAGWYSGHGYVSDRQGRIPCRR